MKKKFYGKGIPGVDVSELKGSLIVLEGGDGAGRTTQTTLLKDWLERIGYPTLEVGLKRSELAGKELMEVMKGNMLCPLTLSLFYVTDFADQLENVLIPALRAGFVVLADRYIYTLMARHIVRGVHKAWMRDVCEIALVPDLVFHLRVKPQTLVERSFRKRATLDFWESGMDIERSGDMFHCFMKYQRALAAEFEAMAADYNFVSLNGDRDVYAVHNDIINGVKKILKRPELAPLEIPEAPAISSRQSARTKSGGKRSVAQRR